MSNPLVEENAKSAGASEVTNTILPINQILQGDMKALFPTIPDQSIDLVFVDPPYYLRIPSAGIERPGGGVYVGAAEDWDKFESPEDYEEFTRYWLTESRRVLKPAGALWVIGTYHCIYTIGYWLLKIGFSILSDVCWFKNGMPNFRGVRLHNTHETLVWARMTPDSKYTFNYRLLKEMNKGKQMSSIWTLNVCAGEERLKKGGVKVHSTQKPEALMARILHTSTNEGDIVLDPCCGTGTMPAVARKLGRRTIGFEREADYVTVARERLRQFEAHPQMRLFDDLADISPAAESGGRWQPGKLDLEG